MSTLTSKKTLVVAGLTANVYSNAPLTERGRPLAVLFLLHGRLGSADAIQRVVEGVLRYAQAQGAAKRELIVVTFVSGIPVTKTCSLIYFRTTEIMAHDLWIPTQITIGLGLRTNDMRTIAVNPSI